MFIKLTKQCYKTTNLHSFYNIFESESHPVMFDSLQPHGLYSPWNSPGQNTGVGILSLLQGIFPTQGSNPGLLHCRFFTSRATRDIYLIICKFTRRKFTCANSCIVLELAVEILINMATFQWGNGKFHNFSNIQLVICDGGRIQTCIWYS